MDYYEKKDFANVISVAYQFAVIFKVHSRRSCGHLVNINVSAVKKLRCYCCKVKVKFTTIYLLVHDILFIEICITLPAI